MTLRLPTSAAVLRWRGAALRPSEITGGANGKGQGEGSGWSAIPALESLPNIYLVQPQHEAGKGEGEGTGEGREGHKNYQVDIKDQ